MKSLPTPVRLVIYGVLGYIVGYQLGGCISKANAQAVQNERVQINSNNSVNLRGEINASSTQNAQFDLTTLVMIRGDRTYPIYLVVDSPGGEVDSGIQFIEFAKTIDNLRTITIFGASMAADIVEALPGSRLITQNGELMFHRARGGFQGQFEMGEVESRLAAAQKEVLALEEQNARRMGISVLEYKAKAHDELWLNTPDAIKSRAADKAVDIVCSAELVLRRDTQVMETMFGSVELVYSGCPTFRYPLPSDTIKENLLNKSVKKAKVSKK